MALKQPISFDARAVISRDAARSAGLKQYFINEPCQNRGHVAPRYVLSNRCVVCTRESTAIWRRGEYRENHEQVLQKQRENREKYPIPTLLRQARSRAAKKGIPFTLTQNDVILPENCPCCGVTMKMVTTGPKRPGPSPESPSLDRMIPQFGYVPGNVAVICWRCNDIKRTSTAKELRMVSQWMEKTMRHRFVTVTYLPPLACEAA